MEPLSLSLLVGVYHGATTENFLVVSVCVACGPTAVRLDVPTRHEGLSSSKHV